jgi:hypothetical protein
MSKKTSVESLWRISKRNVCFILEYTNPYYFTIDPSCLRYSFWNIHYKSYFIERAWHLLSEIMELKYYAVFVLIVVLPKLLFCFRPRINTGIFKVVKKHPNVRSCAEKILQEVNLIHLYSVSIMISCLNWKLNVCILVYENDSLFLLFTVETFGRTLWWT